MPERWASTTTFQDSMSADAITLIVPSPLTCVLADRKESDRKSDSQIGSSKRGAGRERPRRRSAGPLGELSDSKRGTGPRRKPDVDGNATTGGLARQAKSGKPWPSGTPGVTDRFRRPPLHAHRIGDGEGVKEGLRRERLDCVRRSLSRAVRTRRRGASRGVAPTLARGGR